MILWHLLSIVKVNSMKKANSKTPINTLVKFYAGDMPKKYHNKYPFKPNEILLFLGELWQMPHHCVVANKKGKVFFGYHTFNFVVLTDDEI